MTNILKESLVNQPTLITKQQLDFLRIKFEREVIDPLFFGHAGLNLSDDEIRQIQADIDTADQEFTTFVAENFELSNEEI